MRLLGISEEFGWFEKRAIVVQLLMRGTVRIGALLLTSVSLVNGLVGK